MFNCAEVCYEIVDKNFYKTPCNYLRVGSYTFVRRRLSYVGYVDEFTSRYKDADDGYNRNISRSGAQSVEDGVTAPLENALQTIPGIVELETRSYDNVSVSILTFDYGVDLDKKIDAIEDTFKTVSFPQGCGEPSFVKIDMNGTAAATVAIYNDNNDLDVLARDAKVLTEKLRAIEGVGSVNALGSPEKQIQITALEGLDITALAIVQALSKENLDLPLGTVLQDGSVVSIRNASDAKSVLEIMRLPVVMDLGASAISSLAAMQTAVKRMRIVRSANLTTTLKSVGCKKVIDETDGKTYEELAERQNALSGVKSLMTLVRENSSQSLRLMWHTIDVNLVKNDQFTSMDDDDLRELSEQTDMSYDLLKWVQSGAKDGTLKENWDKLVAFRNIFPLRILTATET